MSDNLTVDQALKLGIAAHKAGKVKEADGYYTAILKVQPKHPDANHNIGALAVSIGKVEEALPFFKSALEANSTITQFWLSYIDALIRLDRSSEAKDVLNEAKVKGINDDICDELEQRLLTTNKTEMRDLRSETINKAVDLRENGDFDDAINFLKDSIGKFPKDPNLLALLAHCHILKDELEEAAKNLGKARDLDPNCALIGWNEARLLLKKRKVLDALAIATSTNKRFPEDVEGMGVLGSCLRANNNLEESLICLNKALSLNPSYAEALANRGLIYLTKENKAKALTDLENAHKIKPYFKQIWNLVAELTIGANRYSDAISILINMIEMDPNHEKSFTLLFACCEKVNDIDLVLQSFKKVLEIKPNDASTCLNLGIALKRKGDFKEALEVYKKSLAIKPDYATAYLNIGIALDDQGMLEEAVEAYNKAIAIKSDYADAYYGLAATLYRKGDVHGVMTNLEHVISNTSEHDSEYSIKRLPYKIFVKLKNMKADTVKSTAIVEDFKDLNKFPLKIERTVEPELIKCLYDLSTQSLDDTKDARYGAGKCSPDFKLFESEQPIIKKVSSDLLRLVEDALGAQVLHHESFFNILGAGGGSKPHAHYKSQDRHFNLYEYKYSLVYYLSVGDQNCTEPGILKLYEPDIDILPTKGMGILLPATRKHSAVYNGSKDRIMIGCNFYAL